MFGLSVTGETLVWRALDDPPGAWAFVLDDEVLCELAWSRSEPAVRVEVDLDVWRVWFLGVFVVRGVETKVGSDEPQLIYAGNLSQGLALSREGRTFALVSGLDRHVGPWAGFDDAGGEGVFRVRGRIGGGERWSEVSVAPSGRSQEFVGRLLILWGGLQVFRMTHPWLGLTTSVATRARSQRELERLARNVAWTPPL